METKWAGVAREAREVNSIRRRIISSAHRVLPPVTGQRDRGETIRGHPVLSSQSNSALVTPVAIELYPQDAKNPY
jgi:hypothetical protein